MKLEHAKRRAGLLALAVASIFAFAGSATAGPDAFPGKWRNVDNHTSNLTKVHISPDLQVHAWGQCHPADCDWGTVPGEFVHDGAGGTVNAKFNSGFSKTNLLLHNAPGQHLSYDMHVFFTDGSGRAPYDVHGMLERAGMDGGGMGGGGGYGGGGGPVMGAEDCLPEPWAQLQVAHAGGAWKIVDGSEWVLDFGANQMAANQALNIIQHYRFDRICYVKRPHPPMTYWTRSGMVPSGNMPGQDCINFHPNQVAAAHVGGEWKVVEGSMWMLSFGPDKAGAEQAVAVIQHYNLNRQCFVARPNPPMTYWLAQ
jgi:hypothetical protein